MHGVACHLSRNRTLADKHSSIEDRGSIGGQKLRTKDLIFGLIYSIAIGLVFGLRFGGADFSPILRGGRDICRGMDPYRYPVDSNHIPYPLTADLLAVPLTWLNDQLASAVFVAIGTFLLFWFLAKTGQSWRMLLFLSAQFFYNTAYINWIVPITAIYYCPYLSFLVLCKPQCALPLALLHRPRIWTVLPAVALLLLSLLIYPSWPGRWLSQAMLYTGIRPPFFVLPLGPLMVLALLKFREKRAWLLLLMSLMPQRMIGDQLPLLLIAENRNQLCFLVLAGWIFLAVRPYYLSFDEMPGGWQLWIVCCYYLPALLVLLQDKITSVFLKKRQVDPA